MRTPELFPALLPEAPDERVERWLDGDLPPDEARRVEDAVACHPAWRRAANASQQLSAALRATPRPAAPPRFAASVMAQVAAREKQRRAARPSPMASLRSVLRVPAWQPALALATGLLVVVMLWPRAPQPTPEEVAASVEDVKWTLAYLSRTSESAGHRIRDDVLGRHVVAPVTRALETARLDSPR